MKILIVDDNVDSAETTGMLLELMGHETMCANDGAQALEVAMRWLPQMVLLDINLPVLSGYEVAQKLRAAQAMCDSYIVALSGYSSDEDRQKSLAAGCDQHIGKPFDPAALTGLLETAASALAARRR